MNRQQVFSHLPLILDGGLATELEAQGHDLNHPLWSAKLLLEEPQAIIDAHLAYLRAGAECVISASYQASIAGFMALGLSKAQAKEAICLSVELARDAVSQYVRQYQPTISPLVAASVGPYGAYLADGSEYHGNYECSDQQLIEFHQQRLALLADTSAEVLACETIPSLREAKVLNHLLAAQNKPAWISFSCKDAEHINDGQLLKEAVNIIKDNPNIIAIGVNCTSPVYIESLIQEIKGVTDKPVLVYPNSGEDYDAKTKTWHGTAEPEECARAAKSWLAKGAQIIGGCCRMGPDHIKAIRVAIKGED